MATKTFEELKQLAIQIRDEKTNKQNTATRIGTQMLEHLDKLEQDYYDKTATNEKFTEIEYSTKSVFNNAETIHVYKESTLDADNGYTANNTSNYCVAIISVKPNSNYLVINSPGIIKGKIVYFSEMPKFERNSDYYISSFNAGTNTLKFTTPINAKYVGICYPTSYYEDALNLRIITGKSLYQYKNDISFLDVSLINSGIENSNEFTLLKALQAINAYKDYLNYKYITFVNYYSKKREFWITNKDELSLNLKDWENINNKSNIKIYQGWVQDGNGTISSSASSIPNYDIFIAKVNPRFIYKLKSPSLVFNFLGLYKNYPNLNYIASGQPDFIGKLAITNPDNIILPNECNYIVGCISTSTHTEVLDVIVSELKSKSIDIFGNYGQSNAIGNSAFPIITTSGISNDIVMLGNSLHNTYDGNVYLPLKEGKSDVSYCGESCISSELKELYDGNKTLQGFTIGVGGQPLSTFEKGTEVYNNLISYITNSYNQCENINVKSINWIQGESNSFPSPITEDEYESKLKILLSDINYDIKNITKQINDILFLSYQSAWGNWRSYINSNTYARIPLVFYTLHKWLKNFKIVSPCYNLPYLNENNNYIHLSAEGQYLFGKYAARAYRRLKSGNNNICCEPILFMQDGNTLKIKVKTPCPPLVIDTTIYPKVGDSYGFTGFDKEGAFIGITDVKVDYDTIIITSEKPLYRIVYGFGATIDIVTIDDNTGYNKNRGNIRDSQGNDDYVNINSKKYSLHNWLLMFNEVVV